MKIQLSIWFILISFTPSFAQENPIPVYYSPVEMPASLKSQYWGQFDTKQMAHDLSALLQKATGKVFTPTAYFKGKQKGIFLLLDKTFIHSSNEAGMIESDGKTFIRIKARYTTGISYALYSWLADMGFRFYLPGDTWTTIPKWKTVYPEKKLKKIYAPAFRMRMFSASGGIYPVKGLDENNQPLKEWQLWNQRNRMGCDYLGVDGHIGEYFNMVHKEAIEKDSMMVAPIKGRRQYSLTAKLDPTNKKGVALFTDWIVDEFKLKQKVFPGFLPFKKFQTADAGDGLDYCHTPECEKQFSSVSDQMFSIINAAAGKIKNVYPNAGVSTLAYTERADTPTFAIAPNVHVMVVPSAFQSVSTGAELMQRWAKKTKQVSQYDYLNIGVWSYDMPFFNFYQYHRYLQFLQSLHIEGLQYETSLSKFASGIQQYFILRFLCEPYSDPDKILDEFCRNNFEHAAAPIKALLKEWYFSSIHLQTNYDRPLFYADELGRFVQYLIQAENTDGLSVKAKNSIHELKAYTVYLCKHYAFFGEHKNLQAFADQPGLRSRKAEELLDYTWKLYAAGIFHNTQLNDVLKQFVAEKERPKWDFRKSNHFENILVNTDSLINSEFTWITNKYLPQAIPASNLPPGFFENSVKYSADSILIKTMDETAFGNFVYPISFYCATPGPLRITYQTQTSQGKNPSGKIAIAAVESEDYHYIRNYFIREENSSRTISFELPARGHYKLYLGQYNASPVNYIIYPARRNLFYLNKKPVMMNGLLLQDNSKENRYPNKYMAIYNSGGDSLHFNNLYYNSSNTSSLFSAEGKKIPVFKNNNRYDHTAPLPKNQKTPFIFYENSVYRWPPVFINAAPYYFFLKYPL